MRMSVLLVVGLLVVGLIVGLAQATASAETIGKVKTSQANAFVQRGEQRIAAAVGTLIERNDVLETDETGTLGVIFDDDTTIAVGPKSRLTINEFVYNPNQGKFSFVSKLAQGTLSYISGDIAKKSPDSVSIATPSATIGIRGTRLLIRVYEE